MNVSWLNNHHVEQGRTGTQFQARKSDTHPGHTSTTNSETTDNPFFFFCMAITFKKRFKTLGWGHSKQLKVLYWTAPSLPFSFSFSSFSMISRYILLCVCLLFSTHFLVPVTFPISHLLLWTELSPPCCKTTTSLYSVCNNITFFLFNLKYHIMTVCCCSIL